MREREVITESVGEGGKERRGSKVKQREKKKK